jgi:mannan endo-1,4-beta-mannosidase
MKRLALLFLVLFCFATGLSACVGDDIEASDDSGVSQPDTGADADVPPDSSAPPDAGDSPDSSAASDADSSFDTGAPQALYLYDDQLKAPWIDASWDSTVDLSSTEHVFAGSNAIEVDQQAEGALSFLHGDWGDTQELDPADYDELSFSVYSSQALELEALLEGDGNYERVSLGSTAADEWTTLTVSLSELSPNGDPFDRVDILESSGSPVTYYVDEVRLLGGSTHTPDAGRPDTGGPEDTGPDTGSPDTGPDPPSSEFVTVDPNNARFLLDGEPFYFAGTNLYWMVTQRVYGASFIDDSFDMCEDMGLRVIRFWGFADGDDWTNSGDPAIMQTQPGDFNESAFEALDYVISEADKHGLKVIIPFVNYWEAYGGMLQYARWAGGNSREYFYTEMATRQMYKDYVHNMLTRVNTITGVEYRSDPTIMAWELANEARAPFDNEAQDGTLQDWYVEMSAYVRSIDSNHLVATGGEGWDISANQSEYSGGYTNFYALSGEDGSSYVDNTQLPNIDFGSAHLYPDVWGFSDATTDGELWIADHAEIARQYDKPFVLGEFGNADRSVYQDWLQAAEDEDVAGTLMWQIVPASRGRENNMTIVYPDDTNLVNLFTAHAQRMNAK